MNKKLYITYFDQKNNVIFETFIHKIDAVKSYTVIYTQPESVEADIIRLPLNIKSVQAVNGMVTIYYFFGLSLQIERR